MNCKIDRLMCATVGMFSLLLVGGCGGIKMVKMDDVTRAQVRTAPEIKLLQYGPRGVNITTAGNVVAFNFTLGIAGWGKPGLEFMAENNISDPWASISMQLADSLKKDAGLKNINSELTLLPLGEHDVNELQKKYDKGLYLQIIPGQWNVIYYVSSWSRYQMYFGSVARLVRADTGEVVWTATCSASQDPGADKAPTMEQLMGTEAKMFKEWMSDSTRSCVRQLTDKFLSETA